jgi:hypothetical protein
VLLWVWKSNCTPTIKFFAWLLLNDRLNTRNILRRRKKFLEEGYNCALCHEEIEETSVHLFFECSAAACRWFALGISWSDSGNTHQRIYLAKHAFPHPFFMDVFMIAAWCIWTERNRLIFSNEPPWVLYLEVVFQGGSSSALDQNQKLSASVHFSLA